jgi:tetratricopeptide (TPR) repeat protein
MHLVQLVRYLVDERLLEAGPDGWQARPGVDVASVLPPSLADIMALRLDQLEQIAPGGRLRDLLNRCAILGRSFRFSVLERMLRIENRTDLIETVDADIDLLLDEEYLRMRPTRTDDVLAFPSSLVRDTLLERLRNRRTTRRLHANAAEAKLALLGQSPDQIAEDLVRHFAEARDRTRELQYARVAADVAERTHRPHDAASHLARVLTILEESGEEDADLLVWTLLRLGRLQIGLGLYADALAHFQRVGAHAAASPRARVMAAYGEAKTRFTLGEFEAARTLYASAKQSSEALDDPENIARGGLGLARVAFLAGDLDAAQSLASDALEVAEQRSVAGQLPKAIWLLGDIARSRGENASAIDAFERARTLFEAVDDRSGIAKCYARMAMVERTLGNYEAATRNYERAREMYVALGDRKELAHQLNGLGDVARFTGDFTHAANLYRRAVDIFQSMSLPYDAAIALTNLGLVAMEGGRDIEAEGAFRRAAEVAERLGAAYLAIGIGLNLACVLGRLGQENESRTTLDESLALADVSDLVDPDYARPLERMADILAASGDRDAALAALARARSMWAELGRPDDGARVAERMDALRPGIPEPESSPEQ